MTGPAAGEITVYRCVVRVVRRGGWSWGPAPRSLLRQVLDALPDLLAARFAEHLTGDGQDVEITEPVRIDVRLGRLPSPGLGSAVAAGRFVVDPAVVAGPVPTPVPVAVPAAGADPVTESSTVDLVVDVAGSATPVVLFAELAERGELAALLALLPEATLRTYVAALLRSSVVEELPAEVTDALAAELARRMARPSGAPEVDLVELVGTPPGAGAGSRETAETGRPPVVVAGETRTGLALPFLLAGPLARTGYLDAIGPALAGADLLDDAPLFAAALAYKVLGKPARGWRRGAEEDATAAAFAGLDEVADLTGFATRVAPVLPVLDGVLALSLCRGHDPADPLLVSGVDGGLLLVDAQGVFPIAWAADVAGLLPHWRACGRPPVAVCDSPLPPSCLRDLVAAGATLVTDVRPLRDDPLSRMPWRTPLWTSGAVEPRLAAALPGHASRVADLVGALFTTRRAVPRATDDALEHSVTLAASLGLGMIAWTLWHERETPDPVLALTRFADLTATIQFGGDAVRVRLPLGRRHADLSRAGVLADVPNVVWLGGRTLTFSGG